MMMMIGVDDGRKPGAGLFVTGRAAAQSVRPTTRDVRGVQKDLSASSGATPTAIIIIPLVGRRVG